MTTTYTLSPKQGSNKIQVHTNANATIAVAGNSTVSNLTANSTEVVTSARIESLQWGIGGNATAHIVISRGNSTANSITHVLSGAGFMGRDSYTQLYKTDKETGDLYVTFIGSANGFVAMTLDKNV